MLFNQRTIYTEICVPYNQIGSPLVLGGRGAEESFLSKHLPQLRVSGLSQLSTFITFFAHLSFRIMHPNRPLAFVKLQKFSAGWVELKCEVLLPYLAVEWTI